MINRRNLATGGLAATAMLIFAGRATSAFAQPTFPQTIATLRQSRLSEVEAYRKYTAFTKRAKADRFPGIAYLFTALASAELIHGQNFERILARLSVEITPTAASEIPVESTQKNLIEAAADELECVTTFYPKMLAALKPEGFADAITFTTYAWKSEKQHLDILKQIQRFTPDYFEEVASKIENETGQYFVCQICGSTELEIPEEHCPICSFPSTNYRKVEPPI